jgi:hypothetical protein
MIPDMMSGAKAPLLVEHPTGASDLMLWKCTTTATSTNTGADLGDFDKESGDEKAFHFFEDEMHKNGRQSSRARELSRFWARLLFFSLGMIGILSLYVWYLSTIMDVLFEMKEIGLGFENGAIQANVTASSQFLPGRSVSK